MEGQLTTGASSEVVPPAPPAEAAPGAPPTAGETARIAGRCRKCNRPFLRGGKFIERHEAECDGTPWNPQKAPKRLRAAVGETPAAAPEPPSPLEATMQECERAKARVMLEIAAARKHLDSLVKQEASIDSILQKIREAKEP
jgi:hypothetical protein